MAYGLLVATVGVDDGIFQVERVASDVLEDLVGQLIEECGVHLLDCRRHLGEDLTSGNVGSWEVVATIRQLIEDRDSGILRGEW